VKLPHEGWGRATIEARREGIGARDRDWRSGRVFGYVYQDGRDAREIGALAYTRFLTENALDPTVFPSALRFENDLLALAATHLHGDPDAVGSFTSGGTESILLAVKAARDHARATRPAVARPQMVLPDTAHAAFHKAAHYLGLDKVVVPVDRRSFRADVAAMARAITDQTIFLVGSAPSYAHGVVDPIEDLGRLAQERGLWLHVDACVGGWLLPFFERLGQPVPRFDFRVPGVTSISMDLHKYAFCPKGASILLHRDKAHRFYQHFACSQWTGYTIINPTVQSAKSVGPMAAAWAVLHRLGEQGYRDIARETLEGTRRLIEGIQAIPGLRVLGQPDFCLVAVAARGYSVFHVVDEMRRRGWYVQPQLSYEGSPENIHFSLHPGNVGHVDALVADLAEACRLSTGKPTGRRARAVKLLFAAGTPRFSDSLFRRLLELAGVEGVDLPEEMADINEILNALPRAFQEKLLTAYINELYVPAGGGAFAIPEDADPAAAPGAPASAAPEPALPTWLDAGLRRLPLGGVTADALGTVLRLVRSRG